MKAIINVFFVAFWMGCITLPPLSAQPEDIISRTYTMKDGLSHDFATCLFQDSQGFLWVGTKSGLNKFDGYHFTTYRVNPSDSNSLTNNFVKCLWEDKQQRLWIGTDTGLDLFDLKTEKFHHLPLDSSYKSDIGVGNIRERKDGMVWLCTGQGIYLADPETLSITRPIEFPQNVDEIMDIAEARDGSVWAAGAIGLVHVDASTGQTTRYRNDPGDPHSLANDLVWTVHVDRHDRVWVGTDYGLDLFNPEDQSFTHFLPGGSQFVGPELRVNYLLENPDGTFWVGAYHGLYNLDPETGKLNQLTNDYIWSVIRDRRGSIWFGASNGLYQIAPQSKKFTIYRQFEQKDVSFITALAEDANHHIWIAVLKPKYQLFRHNPSSGSFTEYRHDQLNPNSYSGKIIGNFIPDDEGGFWMANYDNLVKFNPKNQTFSNIPIPIVLTTIFKDSQGMLWVGGWIAAGKFDPQMETYEPLADFPRTQVTSFLEDREENIWIGTYSGLFRYNRQTGQLDIFKNYPANPQSLSSNRVYHLMMDQEGTIWLGTDGGLNKMIPGTEKEEPTFIHWQTTTSNLPHDDVFGMVDGGDGTLWLSCGNRISHFFPQPGEFRNYDQHDGLHGKRIGDVAKGLRSHNGEIYFGSEDGLIVFHPDSLQDNPYIPPVVITGFSINNQTVPVRGSYGDTLQWDTPLPHTIPYTDAVELTYQQNDFSLEFASLNFINPENNLYKYKLEPYEEEWIETSASNRIARYTNLSPGQYTFRVIGSNNDGLWNDEGRSLSIIIHPPWWKTWRAYTLYVLLALCAFWIIRHYEIKRLKLRQRAAHLSELDAFKSRFYTNITHEFRTPLTVILGVTDEIDQQYQKIKLVIKRNGLNLLQLVNQMLDLSKLEAGMLTVTLQQGNIIPYIRYIVESFHSLAEHKYIHIHFRSEVPELIMDYDAGKVLNIVSNLLSNAIKFTPEGGHVSLVVRQIQENHVSRFHLRITDTGMGIPADQLPHIFDRFYQVNASTTRKGEGTGIGLSLIQELIKLLGGTIAVKSTVWQGTEFTVELPITNTAPIAEETTQPVFETAGDHGDVLNEGLPPTGERHSQPVALIVEDNVDVVYYLRTCLQDKYTLEVAQNGQDGITKALERMPDIIISDVMMPEKNGYELCETLKNNVKTSHIPIILLTAKAGEEDKIEGLEVGADAYLTKPFNKQELKVQIRNLITQRRKLWSQYNESLAYRPQELDVSSRDQKFLTKALKALEDHKSDPDFSAESLQKELGVSRTLLHVKLKALTGQSTTEFIRTYRLKYAAQLIRQHHGNIAQVAYEAGFNDQSYFTKSFKKHFGIAPSEYAKSVSI